MNRVEMNLRDPADKIGAVLGFVIGVVLVVLVLTRNSLTALTLDGQNIPESTFSHIVLCLLLVGVCVNLTRNLAVGVHDTAVFLVQCIRKCLRV